MNLVARLAGRAALLGLAAMAALWGAWQLWPPELQPGFPFERLDIKLPAYEWYDAGAVDVNGDGKLDLLTINHSHEQGLFLGDGAGGFDESLAELGLNQESAFPGIEDSKQAPERSAEGMYLFWQKGDLVLESVGGHAPVSGHLEIPGEVSIRHTGGVATAHLGSDGVSRVEFTSQDSAKLYVRPRASSVPIQVRLERGTDLARVFIGRLRIQPASYEFTIRLRDRHGAAWADVNGDGRPDAYITRGGLSGRMASMPGHYSDEFLLSIDAGGYMERASEAGFRKKACPGRQVAWVDYNGDGRLDLYVVCGRRGEVFPNQLYEQLPGLRFRDVATDYGLDFRGLGAFAWIDVEQDGDQDLLWADLEGIWLYRNEPPGFRAEEVQEWWVPYVHKIACADFDADGDIDALVVSAMSNRLLINDNGRLVSESPSGLGLPARSKTAAWLDYDNDGLLDFYAWPQGIHLQQSDGQFRSTGIARVRSPFWWLVNARAIWFDADTDGDQDLLVMQRFVPRPLQRAWPAAFPFSADLYLNGGAMENHWLQVDLIGPTGNTSAIGATATISRGQGSTQIWQVGQYDGSHYSQGHYRLYVGLGGAGEVDRLTIRWPDGSRQTLTDLPADRLLKIGIDSSTEADPSLGEDVSPAPRQPQ